MNFNLLDLLQKARLVAWPLGLCSILAVAIGSSSVFPPPCMSDLLWLSRPGSTGIIAQHGDQPGDVTLNV